VFGQRGVFGGELVSLGSAFPPGKIGLKLKVDALAVDTDR
jgi:hypothetical protein